MSSHYFVGSQADNIFYLDAHHTHATVPLRPPTTQTIEHERERGIPIRQATPERRSVSPPPPGYHHLPTSPASSRTGSSTFSYSTASPLPLSNQLSTNSSIFKRCTRALELRQCDRGWRVGAFKEVASDAELDATRVH